MRRQDSGKRFSISLDDEEFDEFCTELMNVEPPADILARIQKQVSGLPRPSEDEEVLPLIWKNHLRPS
jgi:hypothetical protein